MPTAREFSGPAPILTCPLSPAGIRVWNPAFDVTPHELITGGIITELGVFAPEELRAALSATIFSEGQTLDSPQM